LWSRESLSDAAGALGTLLTVWGVRAAAYWFGFTPSGISPEIDHRIVGFGMSLSVVAGVLSTLLPAVRTTRTDQYAALRDRSGGAFRTRTSRAPGALLTAQIASGLILLTGAGLLTSDFLKRRYLDLGFDPRNMYEVSLLGPSDLQRDVWRNTLLALRARAARVPGVASTALEHRSAVGPAIVRPEDGTDLIAPEQHTPAVAAVDPTYFETFGMSLIEGRAFTDGDTRGNRLVAVVNATVAANFWPGASPLGRQLFVGDSIGTGEWLIVIGVADDVERGEFVDRHFPMVYRPFEQAPLYHSGGRLYVRVAASEGVLPVLQRAVREVLGYPASPFESVEEGIAQRLLQARFNALALNAFAAFAVLLAAMGIYGSVAYAVSRRTREIGIRVALGAERGNVLVLVARNAVLTAVAGVVLGLTGSVMITHLFRALVSATSVTSPWIFGGSASLIVAVSVLAAYLPARRAIRVQPVIALRSE
jgi:putative ABC transport system permease protein